MKLKLLAAALCAAGALAPAVAQSDAAALADCCTAGDRDFPKVGGNLGNQNYSRLRQINKGLVHKLGGAWVNRIEGGLASGTNQSTAVAVDGVTERFFREARTAASTATFIESLHRMLS